VAKHRLKVPRLWVEWEVRDEEGRVVEEGRLESQTWVGNVVALISSLFSMWAVTLSGSYLDGRADILDTGGSARPALIGAYGAAYVGGSAPEGDLTGGIVVGSDPTAVAVGQYDLVARIAHGTGAGQLVYGATSVNPMEKTATTWTVRIVRTITNQSGATVTVAEFGLFLRMGMVDSPYWYSLMLARDVPSPAIDVPDGYTLTVRYIVSHTV